MQVEQVKLDGEQNPIVTHLGHLMGHTSDVNTVRFAPSGMASTHIATSGMLIGAQSNTACV